MAGTNSPDLAPYVDLRLFDRDPQQVFEVGQQHIRSRIPEWIPREDNTEVILLEGLAMEVAEAIFAINRIPSAIMVALMKLYGVTRDEGAPPVTTIQINVVTTYGYTIPAGTRFMLSLPGGVDPIIFSTDVAVTIPDGFTSATVAATGNRYTSQANNIPAGTTLELLDSITFIDSAATTAEVTGGRNAESDPEWITRGSQRLRRLVDTLAVPDHFTRAAMEETIVSRATTIDLYDPASGTTVGSDPGHVTVAVYGNGRFLTTQEKSELQGRFSLRALANLTVHVIDPTITAVNVSVNVTANVGYTVDQVEDAVNIALAQYLSPEEWPWRGLVRRNELIALISNLPEVDYVVDLTSPASNFALSGVAPLADLGTVTVTVS